MQDHPLIELYVTISDEQQNKAVEQILSSMKLDGLVLYTLRVVNITEPVMLTLLITDDDGIREMNKQYRAQNKSTDVLSFPLLEKPLVQAPVEQVWPPQEGDNVTTPFVSPPGSVMNLGDVVISWPTITQQATQAGHSVQYELLYLLCHGVLHLVGYDDQTEAGYQAMVRIQQHVLAQASRQQA